MRERVRVMATVRNAKTTSLLSSSSSYGDLPVSEHFFSSLLFFIFRSCSYLWQRLGLCVTMVTSTFFLFLSCKVIFKNVFNLLYQPTFDNNTKFDSSYNFGFAVHHTNNTAPQQLQPCVTFFFKGMIII